MNFDTTKLLSIISNKIWLLFFLCIFHINSGNYTHIILKVAKTVFKIQICLNSKVIKQMVSLQLEWIILLQCVNKNCIHLFIQQIGL